jgi:hypothetical protein
MAYSKDELKLVARLLTIKVTFHVFTPDGDLYVCDDNAGSRVLEQLAAQYPGATVIVTDRNTGEALLEEISLGDYLSRDQDAWLCIRSTDLPGSGTGRA